MELTRTDLLIVLPEILVLGMACVVLVVDLFLDDARRVVSYLLAQATLVTALVATLMLGTDTVQTAFASTVVRDPMGDLLKSAVYLITFGVFVYSRGYLRDRGLFKGEFYVLGLFGVLGMMIMISAHSFLLVYLGLELLALSQYAMVAFHRDSPEASEAAMKYFVLGALASGMLLYGMSIVYGLTGTLDIVAVGEQLRRTGGQDIALAFGLVFIVVGIAFKLGAVPFHMWIPDVYQGAPAAVTLYIGSAPKIAAFALIMRLLVEALGPLHADWQGMLVVLAVLSMALGNVVAIAQTNFKRMLAYSTIAHVGFLLLGILAGTREGYSAAMFYTITYALMAAGAFGVILLLSRAGHEAENLSDLKGLNERSPWFAAMLALLMFSLAGLPPTVGFYAKLSVLRAVVQVDMIWLAVVAVALSVIGLFYYLRVVRLMYFEKPQDQTPIEEPADMRMLLSVNSLATLALGIYPTALMALCVAAVSL
jgi:NADH-quinone oxidoreductase subunit N